MLSAARLQQSQAAAAPAGSCGAQGCLQPALSKTGQRRGEQTKYQQRLLLACLEKAAKRTLDLAHLNYLLFPF